MKKYGIFTALVLLFVFTRVIALLTEPVGVGACEAFRAMAAVDMITAHKLTVLDYAFRFNEGGSIVIAFLVAVLFKLFGVTTLVLHLAPLIFSFVALCLGYLLLYRFSSPVSALLYGLLFIFPPQAYLSLSLIAWGTHVESVVFLLAIIYCLCSITADAPTTHNRRPEVAAFFGVVCVFSVWFCYTNLLAVVAAILSIAFFHRAHMSRQIIGPMVFSSAAGLLLLLLYTISTQGANWEIYSNPIQDHFTFSKVALAVQKSAVFVAHDLPRSFFFVSREPVPRGVLCGLYYAVVLVAGAYIMLCLIIRRDPKFSASQRCVVVFTGIYLLLFLVAYSFSDFHFDHNNLQQGKGYRYAVSLFQVFFLLIAVAIARIRAKGWRVIVMAFVIAPCLWGMVTIAEPENFLGNVSRNPVSYQIMGFSISMKYSNDIVKCLSYSEKLDRPARGYFFWGLGEGLVKRFFTEPERLLSDCRLIPELYRPAFYFYLTIHVLKDESKDLAKVFSFIRRIDQRYLPFVYAAVGAHVAVYDRDRMPEYLSFISPGQQYSFFEGFGAGITYLSGHDSERSILAVGKDAAIPQEYRGCAFRGIGLGILTYDLLDFREFVFSMIQHASMVPERYRRDFIEGIRKGRKAFGYSF